MAKALRSLFKQNPAAVVDLGFKRRSTKITGREILSYEPDLRNKDEFEKILIFELAQDTGNRRRYADSLWWLVVFWLGGIAIFLAVDGIVHLFGKGFLSDAVILALIGGTTASVLALFTIVAHFLFPSNEDLFAVVAHSKFPLAGAQPGASPSATGTDTRRIAATPFDESTLPAHLTEIVSNFSDWTYRAIEAECVADNVSSPVFHYTPQQGLEGILKSGAVRLTHLGDLAKLGDKQEFLYASNLARDALQSSYNDAQAGLLLEETLPLYAQKCFADGSLSMLDEITPTSGPFEVYSASFCRHGDDDFLWREYAANGAGFVLTLSPVLFTDPPGSAARGVMDKIFRVGMRYDSETAISVMQTAVQQAVASISGAELPADGTMAATFFHAMSVRLLNYVIRIASSFKKPCYSPEQEMRLLLVNETRILAPLSANRDSNMVFC